MAGGIPIIKALREGLTANRIQWIAGIINGTTNFILSEMRDKGWTFDVRAQRRRSAWATPRPTHLRHRRAWTPRTRPPSCRPSPSASRCSSTRPTWKASPSCGARRHQLRRTTGLPHQAAGHHQAAPTQGRGAARAPDLVPAKRLIANVEGAMNAVVVQGDAVGTTLYYGKGAGSSPRPAP